MSEPSVLADPPVTGAQSVERALTLLSLVGKGGDRGVALSQVVGASGLNKPTARRLLMALIRARLIEQDEISRRYTLGPELYVLGTLAGRRHGLLAHAIDGLARLSEITGDTSFLTARQGDFAVCLHRQEGSHPVRTHALQTGDQHPLGVGAGSMAILAALPEAEREEIICRHSDAYAGVSDYSEEVIRADVARTQEQGYALNPGRFLPSSWGVGVALRYPDGVVAGALSIAAVDSRLGPERQKELVVLLGKEARVIEARLATLFAPTGGTERRK